MCADLEEDAEAGLDKLVTIMTDNPSIKVELGSHTDSRADDKYNLKLSQKRAQAAVDGALRQRGRRLQTRSPFCLLGLACIAAWRC